MIYELGHQFDLLLEEAPIHAVLKVQASVRMLLAKTKRARLLHLRLTINERNIQRWYRLGKGSIFEWDRRLLQKCIAIIATYNCTYFGSGFYP